MKFFYKVGEKNFYNKLQAICEHQTSNNPIEFISPYEEKDFSIAPIQSLEELIAKHLKDLRREYKKIKLYYSGGIDSHAILHCAMKYEIPIDEIICLKSGIEPADFEIDQFAVPRLKKIRNKIGNTQIIIKTITMDRYYDWYKKGITQEKIQKGACGTHNYLRLHINLNFCMEDYDPEVIHIRGLEKPKILRHENMFYTYIIDEDVEPHINNYQFFSSDIDIQIKQCHQWLKKYKNINFHKETDVWNEQKIWNHSLYDFLPDHSIFPQKNLFFDIGQNFIEHKGKKLFYNNLKDKLAIDWCKKNEPSLLTLWYEHNQELKSITQNKWWNNDQPEFKAIGVFSKFYCLNKKDVKTVDELYPNGFK